jgi:CCR4-NOT transcription complex subunit 1
MEPSLRSAEMSAPLSMLYQGTLRMLLVLLHDFPEFLCDYHASFCDVIPPTCIQLRNLILSAFPRTMKLPDPFTPNLKVDLLPEITEAPRIRSNYIDVLQKMGDYPLKQQLDNFMKTSNADAANVFLNELLVRLRLGPPSSDSSVGSTRFMVSQLNALVLYVGARSLAESTLPSSELNPQAAMELYRFLALNLDTEGRYLLFNAIGNQLRYPNNHTHYFSRVLLLLFEEATQEVVQEQITRVLVERLIVHRPHPWGLLITFIELIKNDRYGFWNRNFTRIAPEIERLFFQVGNSIASHKTAAASGPTGADS